MFRKNFWFITLCVLLILAANFGLNIPLRIAIGANALLILIDVVRRVVVWKRGQYAQK